MPSEVSRTMWVADTNVLYSHLDEIVKTKKIVLMSSTMREVDKHKTSPDTALQYQARKTNRFIFENMELFHLDSGDYDAEEILGSDYTNDFEDNRILACCVKNGYSLLTGDLNLHINASMKGVNVESPDERHEDDVSSYTGIKELFLSPENEEDAALLAEIYEDSSLVDLKMTLGEYLIIWNKDKPQYNDLGEHVGFEVIDTLKYDGRELQKLKFKTTNDRFMGKTKPINIKQRLAFDMMQNKDVIGTLTLGGAGSGKDHIQAAHMMQMLDRGEIDKIVLVRNIQGLKDAEKTGYLPGDLEEKMQPWTYFFSDQIGGVEALEMLVASGKLEIQHFESIRGRSFLRTGVYCTEIQSMTDYHAKVLISRIGEGSYLYMNGDINQRDSEYNKHNSAINTLKKLKGNPMFSIVTLDKTERSDFAALAELL